MFHTNKSNGSNRLGKKLGPMLLVTPVCTHTHVHTCHYRNTSLDIGLSTICNTWSTPAESSAVLLSIWFQIHCIMGYIIGTHGIGIIWYDSLTSTDHVWIKPWRLPVFSQSADVTFLAGNFIRRSVSQEVIRYQSVSWHTGSSQELTWCPLHPIGVKAYYLCFVRVRGRFCTWGPFVLSVCILKVCVKYIKVTQNGVKPFLNQTVKKSCWPLHVKLHMAFSNV